MDVITIIQDLTNVCALVNSFFQNEQKTTLWMNTKNPLLGDMSPNDMVFAGRTDKLQSFIESQLAENLS